MEKIVNEPLKIDLHIHSVHSCGKDHAKVKDNTLDNITTLINKLNENSINLCAITDHDKFNYDMYYRLKCEENKNSIKKVLPGVEFSVVYKNAALENVQLHVVTIFNDNDDEKLRKIESILGKDDISIYDDDYGQNFTEVRYLEILRQIDLDTIMIAHQKNSPTSKNIRRKDANTVGGEKFKEFIFTQYFEAYEFRNKKNEIFMNKFIENNEYKELFRAITSTDCHSWNDYPNMLKNQTNDDFVFTYFKCLPSFKGVVMAITDYSRINKNGSFFSSSGDYLKEIRVQNGDNENIIPLSKGLNVIIGDNSIGKSLLLHELTDNFKNNTNLIKAYKKHMNKYKYNIETRIPADDIYAFDTQGEIREKFEKNKLNDDVFLNNYLPVFKNVEIYSKLIENEVTKFCASLKDKSDYLNQINDLKSFKICENKEVPNSLTIIDNIEVRTDINKKYSDIDVAFVSILNSILSLNEDEIIEEKDKKYLNTVNVEIKKLQTKYAQKEKLELIDNDILSIVKTVAKEKTIMYQTYKTDIQKEQEVYNQAIASAKEKIVELIRKSTTLINYEPNIEEALIIPSVVNIFNYKFISKLNIEKIDNEYITNLIFSIFKSSAQTFSSDTLLKDNHLENQILRYHKDDRDVYQYIKDKLKEKYLKDLVIKTAITDKYEKDLYKELSSGYDSKIYFDLLAYNFNSTGIYIIDQPEDNVSQKAIKEYVLDRFKTMGECRQVIFVTHNPQFIINLDVDNVIFMSREEDRIVIKSGALEYEENYNILKIVADNIDGGIDTINKRWRRYDKYSNVQK